MKLENMLSENMQHGRAVVQQGTLAVPLGSCRSVASASAL